MTFVPRIRTILVSAFLMAAGLPLAVFWFWPQTSLQTFQMDELRNRQALLARNLANSMQDYHRDLAMALQSFAPLIADGRGEEVRRSLESLHFTRICVVQPETGAVLRSFLGEQKGCPDWYSESRRKSFLKLAGNAGVGVSPVAFAVNGPPEIHLVTKTYDVMIVGAISTQFFRSLRAAVDADGDGYTAIVDQTGHVLAHPISDLQNVATDLGEFPPVQQILAGKSGAHTYRSDQVNSDMIAGIAVVDGPGWGVFLPQPIAAFQQAAARVQQEGLMVLSLALAMSAVAGLLIARFISNQVSRIEWTTHLMANGDQTQRVALQGPDAPAVRELVDLGASLNAMADDMAAANESELHLRRSAEQAAAAKAEFLANMSGEIRTPLTSMLDITDTLRLESESERQSKQLTTVTETGRSMLGILDDILDFSQLGSGQMDLRAEPVDLAKITLSVVRLLTPAAHQKGIEVITRVPSADPWLIQGDAGRLRQLLLNLIGNAVKFTETGHVFVDLQIIAADQASASVEITVQDTGIGISQERLDTIFSAFEHEDQGTGPSGPGLGLATCQRITAAMNGALTVESEVDAGSTFQFVAQMPLSSMHADQVTLAAGAFANLRAMVVAAHPLQRQTLAGYLQSFGLTECEGAESDLSITVFEGQSKSEKTIDVVIYDPSGFDFTPKDVQRLMDQNWIGPMARLIILSDPAEAIDGMSELAHLLDKPAAPSDLCAALLMSNGESLADQPIDPLDVRDAAIDHGSATHFLRPQVPSPSEISETFEPPAEAPSEPAVQLFTVSNIHRHVVEDPAEPYDFPAIVNEHLVEADEFARRHSANRAVPVHDVPAQNAPVDQTRRAILIGSDPITQADMAIMMDRFDIAVETAVDGPMAVRTMNAGQNLVAVLIDSTESKADILETARIVRDAVTEVCLEDLMIIGLAEPGISAQERDLRTAGFTHLLKKPVTNAALKRLFGGETQEIDPVVAEMA